ncbi:LytR/AlgR family response regulator transcription factor [Algoriphagus limi]|uniref:LytTR family DNA-binding domain-containing protein n=1 Tax=Algoriphagus limi TaxID=2975273 RepID=A0ABT2G7K4_9BACT|nr:LytTR family DNA-binding domain-containing protein [Algoriphagus limi]MCS5490748.1 LytTR family DNA-binding domain-containing protein [Algoriphagus limi]
MRILLIEDENPAAKRLLTLLKPHFSEAEFFGNLDSVKSAIHWLETNPEPDLIFCDIQLADGLSFEIFQKRPIQAPVIFTTAFDQYAIKAFQVNAVDYLLKPIDPEELERAVDKFKKNQLRKELDIHLLEQLLKPQTKTYKSRFLVRFGEKIQSIPVEEVAFFFSEERVTFLQTQAGKKYVLDQTLEQTESQVDPLNFFRINRKYLVSHPSIEEVLTYSNSRLKVKLVNCTDSDILISREKVSDFKSWLDQ